MLTRFKIGKSKPKAFHVHSEPTTTKHALSQPVLFNVIQSEYNSLMKNETWILTAFQSHMQTI